MRRLSFSCKSRVTTGLLVLLTLVLAGCQALVLQLVSVRPFVDDRFAGWVNMGVPAEELDHTLKQVRDVKGDGPGSWVHEISAVAAGYEKAATEAEASGDRHSAGRQWKTAAVYYYIARFPYISSPQKEAAYQKHIHCYLNYARSFDPPLEKVAIPFEGKAITGYLRIPPAAEPPPVVVVTGGVDTWKSDIDGIIEPLLEQGLAVFAFDIPGTGESRWRLSPANDRIFAAVFAHLKTRADIDADRLGLYEISFGGYYAIRLALSHPDVDAAVNVGGPVALSFGAENVRKVPDVMVATIAHGMGIDPGLPQERMVERVAPFSLDRPGFLQQPQRTPPLLSINGAKDELVPIEDLYIISKRGIRQEEWVYPEEGHCAMNAMSDWAPRAAVWMKARLAR